MKLVDMLLAPLFVLVFLFGLVGTASAVSLLDATATTAITTGWTDLKDTILAVMATAWAPMLGIAAIMIGPRIVKGMFKAAVH